MSSPWADTLLRDLARDEPSFRSLFADANCVSLNEDPVQLQEFVQEFGDTLPKLRRELVWSAPASAAAATARLTTLLVSAVRALHQPAEVVSQRVKCTPAIVARLREKIEDPSARSRARSHSTTVAFTVQPTRPTAQMGLNLSRRRATNAARALPAADTTSAG